jgi:hypothetical protein
MKKKYWREALASFFVVGFGQLLKGEGEKALRLILFFYFILPSIVYLSLQINGLLFLLVLALAVISGIGTWAYNVFDALKHETLF